MIMLSEVERVREELGDEKATRLSQLREYSRALLNASLRPRHDREGDEALRKCIGEANGILAEAGIVSNR